MSIEVLTRQVEEQLTRFCVSFLRQPFEHRSEHSIHIQIANSLLKTENLTTTPFLQITAPDMAASQKVWTVSRIQKEWPTASTLAPAKNDRPEDTWRRGNFDLAILPERGPGDPYQVSSWKRFYSGHEPSPDLIIEVGLDYGASKHLAGDIEKFKKAKNSCPAYFIHLFRDRSTLLEAELVEVSRLCDEASMNRVFCERVSLDQNIESPALAFIGRVN
ncbi:MAG: hypothetical protein HY014_17835 [Acidobacteria bacterium]|nr:hypothetical protein [Acidobacteriota bacterium]MBI3489998.1 hypothetical protein [Acidobacteriota bacterium]